MRITGGELCGRTIKAPKGSLTRPTQDRVRESLFAILGDRIEGARVLDMFAGSGSLGMEAISRGASLCIFVEKSKPAAAIIQENVDRLKIAQKCRVIIGDAVTCPASWLPDVPFDIVFLDPPYSSGLYEAAMAMVSTEGIVSSLGIVVVEREKGISSPSAEGTMKLKRSEKYGATFVDFYQKDSEV